MNNTFFWRCKSFDELSQLELYSVLQLRTQIFVVEQDCVYQDMDNKDQLSYHMMGFDDSKLVAYTRLIPQGISYQEACSIGRVVVDGSYRKSGIGKDLMHRSIKKCNELFGDASEICISAQSYLKDFYTNLGFVATGKEYLEDGILHQEMVVSTKQML